ncbi:MAG: hypothetical protein IJ570_00155 [Prevotella sp.]|nr:hypothetical protein [Prevotella sp.]
MKKSLKKYCLAATMMVVAGPAVAQDFNSSYFTQDFKYRHQLNAAFGNDQGYFAIPVLGNMNIRMQGNFGLGDVLFKNPTTGKYDYTFMHPDVSVSDALAGFNKGDNKISGDIGLTILSAGFKAFGGYNIIELRERTSIGAILPYDLFEFAKDLRNKSYEFDHIGLNAISFAELALGHSHQVNDDLRIGAKLKVLMGVGRADLKIDGMTANLSGDKWVINSGEAQAEVNMKGIEFVNTTDEYERGGTYQHVDLGETDFDGVGLGGFGLGVDLGGEYQVIDGLKVSAALNDLGFINWSNSWLLKQKSGTFNFDGFHDIKIKKEAANGTTMDDQMDGYKDQISDFVNLDNKGDQGSTSTMLSATANLGVEYQLPGYKDLSFGLLGQHHFAGDYSWTEGRLSANWTPLSWLDGGVNVAINSFCTSAGWILNIHPKGFNFFVGMDHILGKQSKEFIPLSSNMQVSVGMNIAWGGSKKSKEAKGSKKNKTQLETPDQFEW